MGSCSSLTHKIENITAGHFLGKFCLCVTHHHSRLASVTSHDEILTPRPYQVTELTLTIQDLSRAHRTPNHDLGIPVIGLGNKCGPDYG